MQALADRNTQGLEDLKKRNDHILKQSKIINMLTERQLAYEEKKKSVPNIYARLKTDYFSINKNFAPGVGLLYGGKKFGIGLSVGLLEKQPMYSAEILIPLFSK